MTVYPTTADELWTQNWSLHRCLQDNNGKKSNNLLARDESLNFYLDLKN